MGWDIFKCSDKQDGDKWLLEMIRITILSAEQWWKLMEMIRQVCVKVDNERNYQEVGLTLIIHG